MNKKMLKFVLLVCVTLSAVFTGCKSKDINSDVVSVKLENVLRLATNEEQTTCDVQKNNR